MNKLAGFCLAVALPSGTFFAIISATAADLPAQRTIKANPSANRRELAAVSPNLLLLDRVPAAARQQPPTKEAPPDNRVVRFRPRPRGMFVTMEILVDGRPLPTVPYEGKTYLPVPRVGQEYTIRVWNHGPRRIAAVVSVDGLSVISGKAASESDSGYLVFPYSNVVIKGWRRNLESVAAFRFVDREKSYAGLTGRPENIGVVGLVAIEEDIALPLAEFDRKGFAAPPGARAQGKVGGIGTEYGREIDSGAYYVPFVRSANKRAITFYYDTVQALREAGVPVNGSLPVPFPRDGDFAPPPPGYKGK
jgi:hypothetical protein